MSPLFFALALCLVVLFVYMGRYSGRVRAEATRFIAAPPEVVQARVADLAQWQAWNPWLEHARHVHAPWDGDTLEWNVPHVGHGRVRVHRASSPQTLRQQVRFWLPFAFKGRSDWRFEPAPEGTRVTWRFKGRVAFTLRAFAATVQGATQLDLRFGLDRLAAALQAERSPYVLTYLGVQEQPRRRHAQQPLRTRLDALAAELPTVIADVRQALARTGLPADGVAVAHYLKTHLKLRTVECRAGVALPGEAELPALPDLPDLPDGLKLHEQRAHTAYVLRFEGPPEALELAWYQGMQRLRVEQLQPHPQLPPSAVYLGESTPGQRGVVELHLPLKA